MPSTWERMRMSIQQAWSAGLDTWKQGIVDAPIEVLQDRYTERWMLYRGDYLLDSWRRNPWKADPRVYRNMSMLWNHTTRVVAFFSSVIYQGQLSSDPEDGAIPIVPDKRLNDEQVNNLMTGIDALNDRWNWQQQMLLVPKLAAALGDLLVEVVDDLDKRWVFPRFVWPGYVTEIELDYIGNVVRYVIEQRIEEQHDDGHIDRYTYRKEVDAQWFRYYRDDKPHDYYGEGSEVPNPYGFCPAVWFRHGVDGLNARGMAAIDPTRQMLLQMNSLFSHARDFQHKAFLAPIIVKGSITRAGTSTVNMFPQSMDLEGSAMARTIGFLQGSADSGLSQATFDIGQTIAQLEMVKDGIFMTHPEATIFDKLADAANVTGPGVARIIAPVKGLVTEVRLSHDTGMMHLYQQALTIGGMRANAGDWGEKRMPDGSVQPVDLDWRRQAMLPFTPGAYDRGEMDFKIGERDVIPLSRSEKLEFAQQAERLQTQWALEYAEVGKDDAVAILQSNRERFEQAMNASVFAETDDEDVTDNEGEQA